MKKTIKTLLLILSCTFCVLILPRGAQAKDELKNTDPEKYYIVLDLNNQIVTVYEKDDNGEYTRIVRQFICSSGKASSESEEGESTEGTPTPVGVWRIGGRERFGKFANFSEYARYWTQLVQDNYFHSVMFTKKDFKSLMKGPYGSLGSDVSHGCIRLLVEDAKWLYYYACPGTKCRVTKSLPTNKPLARALRNARSMYTYKQYNAMQQAFYDEEELPNDKAWVTNEKATINRVSKNAAIIKHLELGEELEILLYNDAWVKVETSAGKQGYVFRGYISLEEGKTDTTDKAYVMRSTKWMFSDKKEDTDLRICKVPGDTTVKVLEIDESTGFTKIQYYTDIGYVKSKYLKQGWGIDYGNESEIVTITPTPKPEPTPKSKR